MDRYWSETMPLRAVPVMTVDATSPVRVRVKGFSSWARRAIMPLACMHAPKHIAQRIRNTVLSMPSMPRVARRPSTSG